MYKNKPKFTNSQNQNTKYAQGLWMDAIPFSQYLTVRYYQLWSHSLQYSPKEVTALLNMQQNDAIFKMSPNTIWKSVFANIWSEFGRPYRVPCKCSNIKPQEPKPSHVRETRHVFQTLIFSDKISCWADIQTMTLPCGNVYRLSLSSNKILLYISLKGATVWGTHM